MHRLGEPKTVYCIDVAIRCISWRRSSDIKSRSRGPPQTGPHDARDTSACGMGGGNWAGSNAATTLRQRCDTPSTRSCELLPESGLQLPGTFDGTVVIDTHFN